MACCGGFMSLGLRGSHGTATPHRAAWSSRRGAHEGLGSEVYFRTLSNHRGAVVGQTVRRLSQRSALGVSSSPRAVSGSRAYRLCGAYGSQGVAAKHGRSPLSVRGGWSDRRRPSLADTAYRHPPARLPWTDCGETHSREEGHRRRSNALPQMCSSLEQYTTFAANRQMWGTLKPSPSAKARELMAQGGFQAVWEAVGAA
jgi:hypothetical protein